MPDVRISAEEKQVLMDWIADNAKRYWLSEGGQLRPAAEGGADVIMVSLSNGTLNTANGLRLMILKCPV